MFDRFDLWTGRNIYSVEPAVSLGLNFCCSIRRNYQFCSLLRQLRGIKDFLKPTFPRKWKKRNLQVIVFLKQTLFKFTNKSLPVNYTTYRENRPLSLNRNILTFNKIYCNTYMTWISRHVLRWEVVFHFYCFTR